MATKIESIMWVLNDEQTVRPPLTLQSKEYSSKYRQLQTALRNDDNYELRLKVLTGEIDPMKLPEMTQEQLAPKSLQERMEQQKKKFFEEQVIVNDPLQIIVKSHKVRSVIE